MAQTSAKPIGETKHLNQADLARRWRISSRTLERWRWLKRGPAFLKIGGHVVYRLEDVEDFEQRSLRSIDGTVALGSHLR